MRRATPHRADPTIMGLRRGLGKTLIAPRANLSASVRFANLAREESHVAIRDYMHTILRYRRMSGAIETNTTIIPTEANAKIALFICFSLSSVASVIIRSTLKERIRACCA